MSDQQTQLTPEELKQLQEQQQQYTQLLTELGTIEVILEDLNKQLALKKDEKENVFNNIKSLRESADFLQKQLVDKYGNIDVDLNTGIFTSL